MLISCPFCGPRESGEFTYLGDAAPKRPIFAPEELDSPAVQDVFYDYVYLRENLAGDMEEYWYHGGGCRSWLVAVRNTVTHEFKSVRAAVGAGAGRPEDD
jgi:heterotetrameric sarcosine oxidase delta subunit